MPNLDSFPWDDLSCHRFFYNFFFLCIGDNLNNTHTQFTCPPSRIRFWFSDSHSDKPIANKKEKKIEKKNYAIRLLTTTFKTQRKNVQVFFVLNAFQKWKQITPATNQRGKIKTRIKFNLIVVVGGKVKQMFTNRIQFFIIYHNRSNQKNLFTKEKKKQKEKNIWMKEKKDKRIWSVSVWKVVITWNVCSCAEVLIYRNDFHEISHNHSITSTSALRNRCAFITFRRRGKKVIDLWFVSRHEATVGTSNFHPSIVYLPRNIRA